MAEIKLKCGTVFLVDDQDMWLVDGRGSLGSRGYIKVGRHLLHRIIMGSPKGMHIDHISGDKLDNRRCNLRICTPTQNQANRKPNKNCGYAGFKGVTRFRKGYRAIISRNRKVIFLGLFDTPELAAAAYNHYAAKIDGEFARLNDVPPMIAPRKTKKLQLAAIRRKRMEAQAAL